MLDHTCDQPALRRGLGPQKKEFHKPTIRHGSFHGGRRTIFNALLMGTKLGLPDSSSPHSNLPRSSLSCSDRPLPGVPHRRSLAASSNVHLAA